MEQVISLIIDFLTYKSNAIQCIAPALLIPIIASAAGLGMQAFGMGKQAKERKNQSAMAFKNYLNSLSQVNRFKNDLSSIYGYSSPEIKSGYEGYGFSKSPGLIGKYWGGGYIKELAKAYAKGGTVVGNWLRGGKTKGEKKMEKAMKKEEKALAAFQEGNISKYNRKMEARDKKLQKGGFDIPTLQDNTTQEQPDLSQGLKQEVEQAYQADMNTPALETATAKAAISAARTNMAEQAEQAATQATRGGGTAEAKVAAGTELNKNFNTFLQGLTQQGEANRQAVRGQYFGLKSNIAGQYASGLASAYQNALAGQQWLYGNQTGMSGQNTQSWTNFGQNVINQMPSLIQATSKT